MLRQVGKVFLPIIFFSVGLNSALAAEPWARRALKLQNEIDLYTPLNQATIIGTHNSYNSKSYQTQVRYKDPNQQLSVYEQLEAGVRSVEFDAHWTLSTDKKKDILLCHGGDSAFSCSPYDRKISEGLQEIRDWIKKNPNQIVLLYIERHLDGHESQLASLLDEYLGNDIYKPTAVKKNKNNHTCIAIPSTMTKADVLTSGKQVVVVTKGCAEVKDQDNFSQVWNDFAFAGIGNIPNNPNGFIDSKYENFTSYPDCAASTVFSADPEHTSMWRIYEDRRPSSNDKVNIDDSGMKELMRCNINWVAMDMLQIEDSRLAAAIWSWAPTYPQEGHGQCTIYKNGDGIENVSCSEYTNGYACQNATSKEVKAINIFGKWSEGESYCKLIAGNDWHFIVPVNGKQMNLLKESMTSQQLQEVWLNYTFDDMHWIANSN